MEDVIISRGTNLLIAKKRGGYKKIKNCKFLLLKEQALLDIKSYDNFLWFSVKNQGIYKCELKNDSIIIKDHFLHNKSISRVYKNNKNEYWFQSLNEGVFYMPNI